MLWNFIKQNIFTIIIIVTLIVAMPWLGYLFMIPLIIVVLGGAVIAWRVHKLRQQFYKDAQQRNQQQSWWQHSRNRNDGEVRVVRTEKSEQRINDNVGEYVDFKEVKEEK